MTLRVWNVDDVVVVAAERRLVVGNRQDLKTTMLDEMERGRRGLVIDFGGTDLIDSGGLGVLVTLYRQAEEVSAKLVLTGLSHELRELLRLTKLETIFVLADTVEDAVRVAGTEAAPGEPAPQAPASQPV